MNPVTFNDEFRNAIIAREGNKIWEKAAVSPLFEYSFDTTGVQEKLQNYSNYLNENDEVTPFPFPYFRGLFMPGDKKTLARFKMVVMQEDNSHTARVYVRTLNIPHEREAPLILLEIYGLRENNVMSAFHIKKGWRPISQLCTIEEHGLNPEGGKYFHDSVLKSVFTFCADVNIPGTHMAEIRPNQPGRSAQWVKARTHYTLITHGHPANRKTVKQGDRVASDPEEEIIRMAHNRRAHFRTYHHTRYTYARGSTRWVKAAWVGPKEWQDEGGHQIYKILEPVQTD